MARVREKAENKHFQARTMATSDRITQWVESFLRSRQAAGHSPGTQEYYREKLKAFVAWCPVATMRRIDAATVRAYIIHLQQTHNPGGVHGHYRALRAFVRWWAAEVEPRGWKDPFAKVKAPKVVREPLEPASPEIIKAMLKHADARSRAIVMMLYDTGLRASELCALNLDDVDLVTGAVVVRAGKGGKQRMVFVGAACRRALRAWLRQRKHKAGPLFTSQYDRHLSYNGLWAIVHTLAQRAGVKCPPLHAFRRAFALNALRAGIDVYRLQRLMGHEDLETLRAYLKLLSDDLREAQAQFSPADQL